jgi:hypothetical protein
MTRRSVAALAIATLLAACQGPVAPSNGLVTVVNASSMTASLRWQSPGVLGTGVLGESGTELVAPCQPYARGFPPGAHRITLEVGSASHSFELDAPTSGQLSLVIAIGKDGTVSQLVDAPASSAACG